MKKGSIIIALTILGASMLSPSMAQSYYIEDDIYYTPGEENPVIEQKKKEKEAEAAAAATTATATNTTSLERDVDEYNRRGSYNDEANTYTDATDGTTTGTTFTYYSDEVAPVIRYTYNQKRATTSTTSTVRSTTTNTPYVYTVFTIRATPSA